MPRKKKDDKTMKLAKLVGEGKIDEALELADADDIKFLYAIEYLFAITERPHLIEKVQNRINQLTEDEYKS